MKTLILFLITILIGSSFALGQGENLIKQRKTTINPEAVSQLNFSDKDKILSFLLAQSDENKLSLDSSGTFVFIWQPLQKYEAIIAEKDIDPKLKGENTRNKQNEPRYAAEEGSHKKVVLLHKESARVDTAKSKKKQLVWSPYLSNTRKIKVIYLGPEEEMPEAIRLTIENGKTRLESSFYDLLELMESTAKGVSILDSVESDPNWYLHIAEVNRDNFRAPATLQFHTSNAEDAKPTEIKIHERGMLEFRAGLVGAKLDFQNISLANDTLSISTDSAGRANWKENLVVGIEWHCPRDYDRMLPIWKTPGKRIYERIGVMAGFKVSARPFDAFYLGGSLAITRDFALWAGVSLQQQPKDQIMATSAADLPSALKTAQNERTQPKLFLGISVSPSGMVKALKD